MKTVTPLVILSLCLFVCLAGPALAAPTAPARAAQDGATPDDLPPAEAPPELSTSDQSKLTRSLKKLTTRKLKARLKVEADVLAFGRGALPLLVDAAATTSEAKQEGIARCMLQLADMRDWDLVEQLLDSDEVALRRFAARKAGELQLAHLMPALKERLDDEDAEVRLEASVSVTALGSEAGLNALAVSALEVFLAEQDPPDDEFEAAVLEDRGTRIRAALAGLADMGPHQALIARLQSDPDRTKSDPEGAALERRSAIELLRAIGDRAAVRGLSKALDDSHNVVQRDAINALRQIVEDAQPFDGKSIFQQINEVKRLKGVLKTWK